MRLCYFVDAFYVLGGEEEKKLMFETCLLLWGTCVYAYRV